MDTKFKKGQPSWNKGLVGYRKGVPRSEKTKEKMRESHKKRIKTPRLSINKVRVEIECLVCKNIFGVVLSRSIKAKFCSLACRHASIRGKRMANNGVFKSKTYGALHYRVRKLRGTPSLCEVCGTATAKKFEWANLTGKYEDVNDYKRMCTSCHNVFDGKIKNILKNKERSLN